MDYEDLGRRVREYRLSKGWSQTQMAEAIGVCPSFEGHLERGTRKASLETIVSIANVTGLSLDFLLAASLDRPAPDVEYHEQEGRFLSANQRHVMREILDTIQNQLIHWNEPDPPYPSI